MEEDSVLHREGPRRMTHISQKNAWKKLKGYWNMT